MLKTINSMKLILILSLLTALISCNNAPKSIDKQEVPTTIVEDSCHQLSKKIDYHAESERDRTTDFTEGSDTFRIVTDTADMKVYLQKKVSVDCWKTLERTFRNHEGNYTYGVKLIDLNDDGFIDISDEYKMFTEITFYDPRMKGFRNDTVMIDCSDNKIYSLPNKVKYDICSCCPHQIEAEVSSDLYRFEDFNPKGYAQLSVSPRQKTIELSFNGNKRLWQLNEFPAFMKDDHFDADDFIKDYWEKNWKEFVPN
jgi:hypothetical protein